MPDVDFNFFLNRKYALLQQQADAGTSQASTAATVGAAQANNLTAAAGLDRVKTQLLPGESASQIALQGAQRNLVNNQASVVVPEATARIAQIGAETGLTTTNDRILQRNNFRGINGGTAGVDVAGSMLPALAGVMGTAGAPGFKLGAGVSSTRPAALPGESRAAYMDRTGWGY